METQKLIAQRNLYDIASILGLAMHEVETREVALVVNDYVKEIVPGDSDYYPSALSPYGVKEVNDVIRTHLVFPVAELEDIRDRVLALPTYPAHAVKNGELVTPEMIKNEDYDHALDYYPHVVFGHSDRVEGMHDHEVSEWMLEFHLVYGLVTGFYYYGYDHVDYLAGIGAQEDPVTPITLEDIVAWLPKDQDAPRSLEELLQGNFLDSEDYGCWREVLSGRESWLSVSEIAWDKPFGYLGLY